MRKLILVLGFALIFFAKGCDDSSGGGHDEDIPDAGTDVSEDGQVAEGVAGGPCYVNGTCDPGLACNESILCVEEIERGGPGQPCELDGSCYSGLSCEDDTCLEPSVDEGMVRIPSSGTTTTFRMGCPDSDVWCDWTEEPVHTVTLSAYHIDVNEVTAGEYEACVSAGVCETAGTGTSSTTGHSSLVDHPINFVSWEDANTFCAWAGKRLPTEAEWERAAKGESHRRFPWGDECPASWEYDCAGAEWESGRAKANCGEIDCNDGFEETSPVGSFPSGASPEGVNDLSGNVWEWTSDWFGEFYYSSSPENDPPGPISGGRRVIRGGGYFYNIPDHLRASMRDRRSPTSRNNNVGFRCARSAP